ncbi:30S ribosomal protein S9 [Candidatus Kaiserbacteria bacterium]|nr:30S ribosomal protein S9 [Candidatus Kaiserbacteria bacterium]
MATETKNRYVEGIGRRKTATARVRITPDSKTSITINGKKMEDYFPHEGLHQTVKSVLATEEAGIGDYSISAKVLGGGTTAQAEAIRLGIARALVIEKADRRIPLKREGYLKRDSRSVERKKFGLKKARKAPTWSKR